MLQRRERLRKHLKIKWSQWTMQNKLEGKSIQLRCKNLSPIRTTVPKGWRIHLRKPANAKKWTENSVIEGKVTETNLSLWQKVITSWEGWIPVEIVRWSVHAPFTVSWIFTQIFCPLFQFIQDVRKCRDQSNPNVIILCFSKRSNKYWFLT